MATFFMFGSYSPEAVKGITAQRTTQCVNAIKKCGGEIKEIYALLGDRDLVFITDMPSMEDAMKASLALGKLTGISFCTSPAIQVSEFDKLMSDL